MCPAADLYFQHSRHESWVLEDGIVKEGSHNIEQGVGVRAISGEKSPQAAMDSLALAMDDVLADLQRTGMRQCTPRLNPQRDPARMLTTKGAPWKKLDNEKPKGETIAYDRLLQAWKEGRVQ